MREVFITPTLLAFLTLLNLLRSGRRTFFSVNIGITALSLEWPDLDQDPKGSLH